MKFNVAAVDYSKNIFGTHCLNFSKARPQNKKEFFDASSF